MKAITNKNVPTYTGGYVFVYKPNWEKNSAGQTIKTRKLSDMTLVCKLKFNERYRRIKDFDFAESVGKNLDFKISTPLYQKANDTSYLILHKSKLYSIYQIDPDEFNRELYFYLEDFGDVDTE